jgi:hypothetical protein
MVFLHRAHNIRPFLAFTYRLWGVPCDIFNVAEYFKQLPKLFFCVWMLFSQPLEFGPQGFASICPKCLVSRDWVIGHFGQAFLT